MSPAVAILQAKTHPQSRERLSANSIRVSLFGLDVRPHIRLIRNKPLSVTIFFRIRNLATKMELFVFG